MPTPQRGGARVEEIFAHDGGAGVAERLQDAKLPALLLHHAGHGGDADERGDQEEEEREDLCHVLDDHGIAVQAGIAHVGPAAEGEDRGLFQLAQLFPAIIQLRAGILQLPLCVCEFFIGFCALFRKLLQAFIVRGPAVRKCRQRIGKLCLGIGKFRFGKEFGLFQLFRAGKVLIPAGIQLCAGGIDLALGGVQLLFCGSQRGCRLGQLRLGALRLGHVGCHQL